MPKYHVEAGRGKDLVALKSESLAEAFREIFRVDFTNYGVSAEWIDIFHAGATDPIASVQREPRDYYIHRDGHISQASLETVGEGDAYPKYRRFPVSADTCASSVAIDCSDSSEGKIQYARNAVIDSYECSSCGKGYFDNRF